ncbi:MAG: hypothetical protein LBL34_01850 [Clostridiales bacterium]|jgi:hypothetical protein|nr:hypothetical protein [Clostridiales bacterium]
MSQIKWLDLNDGIQDKEQFILENIEENTGAVVTESSRELYEKLVPRLTQKGFEVSLFTCNNKMMPNYDPFDCIEIPRDVLTVSRSLIKNTAQYKKSDDPFWEKLDTAFLQALLFYVLQTHAEDRNFTMVMNLLRLGDTAEKTIELLDQKFAALKETEPESFAVKQWDIVKLAAGNTIKTSFISTCVRLSVFNMVKDKNSEKTEIKNLTNGNHIVFVEKLNDEVKGVFSPIVELFKAQLLAQIEIVKIPFEQLGLTEHWKHFTLTYVYGKNLIKNDKIEVCIDLEAKLFGDAAAGADCFFIQANILWDIQFALKNKVGIILIGLRPNPIEIDYTDLLSIEGEISKIAQEQLITLDLLSVDNGIADLESQLPMKAKLIKHIPVKAELINGMTAENKSNYWIAKCERAFSFEGEMIEYIVLAPRLVGQSIHKGVGNVVLSLAYVTDNSLLEDVWLDFKKCKHVGANLEAREIS